MLSLISDEDIYRYICRGAEKIEEGIAMKRRCIAALLFLCMFIPSVSTRALAEVLEQSLYPDEIGEPHVETDNSLSTGQVTVWSCITFGSYPQTEIAATPSDAVVDDAIQEGNFLEDPDLYNKLTQAE